MPASSETVVIGAGPAGLTAALELARRGHAVTVLEASGEIGGISRTLRRDGGRMDIGGHRFFSKDERVISWWRDVLPLQGAPAKDDLALGRECRLQPGGPDPEGGDAVMLMRRRVSRIYWDGRFLDYPPSLSPATLKALGPATAARVGASYLGSCIRKLPEGNLENFYVNRFGRQLYRMFFEGYTEKVWGEHPSRLSADWGAQRVKGVSVAEVLRNAVRKALSGAGGDVEASLIEEFWYPKLGPGQLWERVASMVEDAGGRVLTGKEVVSLEADGGRIAAAMCADGSRFEAGRFISSMPLCELVPALGSVDPEVSAIAAGLPYRDFVTVGMLVDRLAIRNETATPTLGNIVPDCWIYVQDPHVALGRVQVFNNWSPYLTPDPERTVWLGLEYFCAEGDGIWELDEATMAEFARMELEDLGVLSPDAEILFSCRERVKKAYPAYSGTYRHMPRLREWLGGFENLYCVGRNGQHRYNNMDHSMLTAFATVDAIEGCGSRDAVWEVNTEAEYHEGR